MSLLIAKSGKYTGFCLYGRYYLLWSPVIRCVIPMLYVRSVGRFPAFDDDGTDAATVGRTGGRGRWKGDLRGRLHRRVRLEPHASQGLCDRDLQSSKTSVSVFAQSIWSKSLEK